MTKPNTAKRDRRIYEMHLNGIPYRDIAAAIGVSAKRVGDICRELRYRAAYNKPFPWEA